MATPTDRQRRDGISKIATFAHWSIWGVTTLIAVVFAGITLKEIPYGTVLSQTNPAYFQAVILSIFVLFWAIGTSIDTFKEDSIFLVDPKVGRVRAGWFLAVAGLATISVVLLLVRDNELRFSLALAAFSAIDVLTWLYLR